MQETQWRVHFEDGVTVDVIGFGKLDPTDGAIVKACELREQNGLGMVVISKSEEYPDEWEEGNVKHT